MSERTPRRQRLLAADSPGATPADAQASRVIVAESIARLSPAEFAELLATLGIPSTHLPPAIVPPIERAHALIDHVERHHGTSLAAAPDRATPLDLRALLALIPIAREETSPASVARALDAELAKLGLRNGRGDWALRRDILLTLARNSDDGQHTIALIERFVTTTTHGADLFWAREALWRLANHAQTVQADPDLRKQALAAACRIFDHISGREQATHQVRLLMCPLAAANCVVGSARDEPGRGSNEEQRSVKLVAFSISRVPVTERLYARFDPAHGNGSGETRAGDDPTSTLPVVEVCWYEALMFAEWVGADLPTEAEWEYACRAGTSTRFCFGDDESALERFAWYSWNSQKRAQPVQLKGPNDWGIFDMHGNVWEWCEDPNSEEFVASRTSGAPRNIRGGSWCSKASGVRSAQRSQAYPDACSGDLGIRLALRSPSQAAAVLINHSRSKVPHAALMEWSIQQIGYSGRGMSCAICGQRILYFVRLKNCVNDADLVLGRDCHTNLLKEPWAREAANARLSEDELKSASEKRLAGDAMRNLRQVSDWQLPDLDYGSWKRWFLDQSARGLLPSDLQDGVKALKSGLLIHEDLVDRFVDYHNAQRKFPGHILIPHARLRGLFHQPSAIPVALTVDEAIQFAKRDMPRADLGTYVVERLKTQYECLERSSGYCLALAYNYILCLARGYEGAENKMALWRYLCDDPLLRRNPAFDGLSPDAAIKGALDVEMEGTLRVLAAVVLSAFSREGQLTPYGKTLVSRLEHISRTGRPAVVWPLASADSPNLSESASARGPGPIRSMFAREGIDVEGSTALAEEACRAWGELPTCPQDMVILAGWVDAAYQRSHVAVLMTRHRSVIAIGLNRCWARASQPIRRSVLGVIVRDLDGVRQDEHLLRQSRQYLNSVEPSCGESDPRKEHEELQALLMSRFGFDMKSWAEKEPPPRLVDDGIGETLRYDRWAHTLYVPTTKLARSRGPSSGQPSTSRALAALSSVEPLLEPPPRSGAPVGSAAASRRSASRVHVPDVGWFSTKWLWVQPDENALDATFSRRFCLPYTRYAPYVHRRDAAAPQAKDGDD